MRPQKVSDQEILSKTREMLIKHGAQVSTDAIANELDISQPALFKRFKTKRGLIIEALKPPEIPPWVEVLKQGPDARPFMEQLEELLGLISNFFKMTAPVMNVLMNSGISPKEVYEQFKEPPPVASIKHMGAWLERCADKGLIQKNNANVVAAIILGGIHLRIFVDQFSGKTRGLGSIDEYIREIPKIFFDGLGVE